MRLGAGFISSPCCPYCPPSLSPSSCTKHAPKVTWVGDAAESASIRPHATRAAAAANASLGGGTARVAMTLAIAVRRDRTCFVRIRRHPPCTGSCCSSGPKANTTCCAHTSILSADAVRQSRGRAPQPSACRSVQLLLLAVRIGIESSWLVGSARPHSRPRTAVLLVLHALVLRKARAGRPVPSPTVSTAHVGGIWAQPFFSNLFQV